MAASLPSPAIGQGSRGAPLRFVPFVDLAVLDPIVTTTYVTRNYAYMVYDTLYGNDLAVQPQPQMAEGHSVEADGRLVRIRLREGLRFHDGEAVRAADAVASIRRWAARDGLGQILLALADEIAAEDDRTVRIRLKRPFPLLFFALGKTSPPVCFIMPERVAAADASRPITETIGSGPFRWVASERVAGARAVFARNERYVPRADAPVEGSAGPKRAHFERVEWVTIPDAGTATAALQTGEVDWLENASLDLLPVLKRNRDLNVWVPDASGTLPFLRFNHLHPPFDNAAMRRALLPAVVQADCMRALLGENRELWDDAVGFFPPGTPMASNAGMAALTGPRSIEAARAALLAAGYKGERVTYLAPADLAPLKAICDVVADMLVKVGINLDYAVSDWASVVTRRANRNPPAQGGWNLMSTYFPGLDFINPAVHVMLRSNGAGAWPGWPDIPALEALRAEWMETGELAAQQSIAARMQEIAFQELPHIPLGRFVIPTAHRRSLAGMVSGPTVFWNLRRDGA